MFYSFPLLEGCPLFITFYVFERLSILLADKKDVCYGDMMSWLQYRISFSLLCSTIDCLRGAQSSSGYPANFRILDLALSERQLSQPH